MNGHHILFAAHIESRGCQQARLTRIQHQGGTRACNPQAPDHHRHRADHGHIGNLHIDLGRADVADVSRHPVHRDAHSVQHRGGSAACEVSGLPLPRAARQIRSVNLHPGARRSHSGIPPETARRHQMVNRGRGTLRVSTGHEYQGQDGFHCHLMLPLFSTLPASARRMAILNCATSFTVAVALVTGGRFQPYRIRCSWSLRQPSSQAVRPAVGCPAPSIQNPSPDLARSPALLISVSAATVHVFV